MSNEIAYYKNLAKIMITTRGTRFTAARLLVLQERFSVATLAMLSIFLIAISVVLLTDPAAIGADWNKFFGTLSIISSVWILVITLFDYALGRGLVAHKLQQNAIKITIIARKLERELEKDNPDLDLVRTLAEAYEQEVAETQVNHTPSDYRLYMYIRQIPESSVQKFLFPIRNFIYRTFVFCMSIPSNLIVLVIVFSSVVWYLLK